MAEKKDSVFTFPAFLVFNSWGFFCNGILLSLSFFDF